MCIIFVFVLFCFAYWNSKETLWLIQAIWTVELVSFLPLLVVGLSCCHPDLTFPLDILSFILAVLWRQERTRISHKMLSCFPLGVEMAISEGSIILTLSTFPRWYTHKKTWKSKVKFMSYQLFTPKHLYNNASTFFFLSCVKSNYVYERIFK